MRHEEQHLDETVSRFKLAISDRLAKARRRLHELEISLSALRAIDTISGTRKMRTPMNTRMPANAASGT